MSQNWIQRLVDQLPTDPDTEQLVLALEMAGELKAVRLKILLARCYEILYSAFEASSTPTVDAAFLDEVLAELK